LLSLEECKRILAKHGYSDGQIEEIRRCLYQVAELFVKDFLSREGGKGESKAKDSGE